MAWWAGAQVASCRDRLPVAMLLTQIFPGGNNKATILTNVYFVLNLYNFPCCIDVHNLCIDVRCIVINN